MQAVLMASAVGAAAGSSRGEEATSNSGSRDARADVADEREGGAVADGGGDDDDNQVKDSEDSVSGARTMRLLWRALDGLLTAEAEEDRYQIPRLAGDSASSGSDQGAEDAASTARGTAQGAEDAASIARGTALRLAAARGRRDEVTGLLEEAAQAHTIGASGLRSGWAASVWAAAQIAAVGGDDWLGRRLLAGCWPRQQRTTTRVPILIRWRSMRAVQQRFAAPSSAAAAPLPPLLTPTPSFLATLRDVQMACAAAQRRAGGCLGARRRSRSACPARRSPHASCGARSLVDPYGGWWRPRP